MCVRWKAPRFLEMLELTERNYLNSQQALDVAALILAVCTIVPLGCKSGLRIQDPCHSICDPPSGGPVGQKSGKQKHDSHH